jgi:hypothetical protein
MSKKRISKKEQDLTNTPEKVIPTGTTLYCWKFNHPKFGWCGGHKDDWWEDKESVIRDRMVFCPYETELISKVTT